MIHSSSLVGSLFLKSLKSITPLRRTTSALSLPRSIPCFRATQTPHPRPLELQAPLAVRHRFWPDRKPILPTLPGPPRASERLDSPATRTSRHTPRRAHAKPTRAARRLLLRLLRLCSGRRSIGGCPKSEHPSVLRRGSSAESRCRRRGWRLSRTKCESRVCARGGAAETTCRRAKPA